jgi:hypothetical protein
MEDYEPFSARQRNASQSDQSRVYQYDILPETFRNQVIHIWRDAAGFYEESTYPYNRPLASDPVHMNWFWNCVVNKLSREYGVFGLGRNEMNAQELCE